MLRMTTNTTTVSTRNTKYFHWSGAREPPGDSRRIGRSTTAGRLPRRASTTGRTPPPVIDENCSMISGNNVATARVTSARYRPLIRSAGETDGDAHHEADHPGCATDGHTGQPRSVIRSGRAGAGPVQRTVTDDAGDLPVVAGEEVEPARRDGQRHPADELLDPERREHERQGHQHRGDHHRQYLHHAPHRDAARAGDGADLRRRAVAEPLRRSYPLHLLSTEQALRPGTGDPPGSG